MYGACDASTGQLVLVLYAYHHTLLVPIGYVSPALVAPL